jgi:hypothetical protein
MQVTHVDRSSFHAALVTRLDAAHSHYILGDRLWRRVRGAETTTMVHLVTQEWFKQELQGLTHVR